MLPVQLYPADFMTMIVFLGKVTFPQLDVSMRNQPVSIAVLMAYQARFPLSRIFSWKNRNPGRLYSHNMPPHVAVALYHELINRALDDSQQSLLNQLDKALVDYRLPLSERLSLTTNLLHVAIA